MPKLYDLDSGQYIDTETAELFPRSDVRILSQQSIIDSQDTTDIIANLFEEGAIGIGDAKAASWLAIKDEYIRQYLMGIGGVNHMDFSHWGRIGGLLSEQSGYFKNMYALLEAGEISAAELRRRLRMYINSANEAYFRALGLEALRVGMDEVNWYLGATEQHCGVCPEWASMGWQPICEGGGFPASGGCQFPGNGNTDCVTNCQCHLEYRNSNTGNLFL